jgi:hypothetical protein
MRYYKTYNFIAVFAVIGFVAFLGAVIFWPAPQGANAVQVQSFAPQTAASVQPSKEDNSLPAANFAADENITEELAPEEVASEDKDTSSLFAQNSLSDSSPIQISSSNSESSSDLASAIDSDPESSIRIIQTDSANTAASAAAAGTSGTGSTSSVAAGSAAGSSGTGSAGSSGAGTSGSSGTGSAGSTGAGTSGSSGTSGSDSSAANGSGSASTGSSGSSGGGGSSGGSDSSYTENTGSPIVQQANYPVFVLPSYQRVLQDEWTSTGTSSAEIFCAKNETESFQILVVNKSNDTLSDIEIVGSGWKPAGSSLAKEPVITLYREHYVRVSKPSYNLKSKTGMYPDALIPFVNPYTNRPINNAKYLANHASVEPQKTQGYWVDVTVGPEVPAGTYTYNFLVTSDNSPIAEIPVTLQVWNFTLPVQPVWTAWFSDVRREINLAYDLPREGSAYTELLLLHQDFLYEHGVYPSFHRSPLTNEDTGDVVFPADFVSDLRTFINKYGARVLYLPGVFSDQPKKLKKFVMAYNAFSQANPWAGQFIYYLDEPGSPEGYNKVRECGQIIEAFAPSIKLLVTVEDISYAPLVDVDNLIDIKVPLFKEATATKIQNYHRDGQALWAYTALTQGGPCWELDGTLFNYRIPAWCSYTLGMEGILYWQTTIWATGKNGQSSFDPWLTQESYYSKDGRRMWNGEGSLLYPGTQAGIKGPVISSCLSRGLEKPRRFRRYQRLLPIL